VGTRYLLPCRCGQHVVVEVRQAGETTMCPCGATLQIPTMLEMIALEPAPAELPQSSGAAWGRSQRSLLVGPVLILMAMVSAVWLYANRPPVPADFYDPEELRAKVGTLTPVGTWQNWTMAKRAGLGPAANQKYEAAVMQLRVWLSVAGIVAAIGAGLTATGAVMTRKARQAAGPAAPPIPSSTAD
jgi:hypothetical protein